jgi:uncharacterized SAM-binding protein YcdF (DUF218 family)
MLLRALKSTRLWGLLGTAVVLYFLFFVVLGNLNMSWIMPDTNRIASTLIKVWPQMPFFVHKEQTVQGEVVYYTVSTHQYTPAELKQMGLTNATPQPAKPR